MPHLLHFVFLWMVRMLGSEVAFCQVTFLQGGKSYSVVMGWVRVCLSFRLHCCMCEAVMPSGGAYS